MPKRHVGIVSSAAFLLVAACSGGGGGGAAVEPALDQLPAAESRVTRARCADLLRTTDIAPVGVTVAPDTGDLYLLDARRGLFVLDANRRFQLVVDADTLYAQVSADSEFTDVAALGNNRFAITARNDGFLLDLTYRTFAQHFCYVPGSIGIVLPPGIGPNPVIEQHTDSVGYDRTRDRIVAQPITIMDGVTTNSEVGTFAMTGGEGDDWHPVAEPEFLAGALTVDREGLVWLGRGDELCTYDLDTDLLTLEQTLTRFDVFEIVGMAFVEGGLLVVDGRTNDIVRIPVALL